MEAYYGKLSKYVNEEKSYSNLFHLKLISKPSTIWTFIYCIRSNLSSRFAVTNEALNNLPEFPDLNVPILVDDILSKQPMDGVQINKLNRTEFLRQLEDFR